MFKRKIRGKKRFVRRRKGMRPNKSKLGLNPAVHNRNYATITETYRALVGGGPATELSANTAYGASVTIAQYPRAQALARCFKFYRLKAVVFEYLPDANTYQGGSAATAETVPYMYYMMNRDASDQSSTTLAQFQAAGVRPIKFTKKIVIAYKPNLIQAQQLVASLGQQGQPNLQVYNGNNVPVYDKWISTIGIQHGGPNNWTGDQSDLPVQAQGNATNPLVPLEVVNVLPYYGHNFYFNQAVMPQGAANVGYSSITAIWEFKEPVLYNTGSTVTEPESNPSATIV